MTTTLAERRQELTDVARTGQATVDATWADFTTAVRDSPRDAVGAWITYRTATKAVAAGYPTLLPATPEPDWPGDEFRPLRDEYQQLSGMAPAIARGTVEGVGANAFTRAFTAAEVADYHRRAVAYRAAYARWEQRRVDYTIWHRLLTPAERETFGPAGDYRTRVPGMAEREQEYLDRQGQAATPGAYQADGNGFTQPAPCPQLASPTPPRAPRLRIPGSVDSFDAALVAALA